MSGASFLDGIDFVGNLKFQLRWMLEDNSTPEPNTGCLLWTGRTQKGGHGYLSWQSKKWLAHRAAFELAHGEVPTSIHIHHVCEQPGCIELAHLLPVSTRQHRRLHAGLGKVVRKPAPGEVGVHLFEALRQLQHPRAHLYPFSIIYPAAVSA